VPAVAGYYTAPNGQMLSFPFNSSTTVFYYNKDAFKAAGLDPNKAAQDLARSGAGRRQAQGQRPQVPVHHQLAELDAARELLAPGTTSSSPPSATASAAWTRGWRSTTPLHVRHIENLANMAQQGLFVYKGRANAADATFQSANARCTPARRRLRRHQAQRQVRAGISTLPYYPDVPGAPQNTVIGGASLWVMAGKKPAEYKGVAEFFNYLSEPRGAGQEPPAHRLPADHHGAFELTEKSGFYKKNPGTDVAA
jgi:sn-glycerol 3-phosphate transport system substrate-binding protein